MRDIQIVFTDKLKDIQKNLENANYSACDRISHDLVNFAWNLELEDEVFISEILEGVFSNLKEMSIGYKIPKEVKEKIDLDISERMKLLADTYNTKDPLKLYESLKQLRYVTTLHQLNVRQNYDTSPRLPQHISKRG